MRPFLAAITTLGLLWLLFGTVHSAFGPDPIRALVFAVIGFLWVLTGTLLSRRATGGDPPPPQPHDP